MAKAASKKAKTSADADLTRFAEAFCGANPFAINRISDPSQMEADVKTVHQAPFDRLVMLANDACKSKRGVGTLLLGAAGVGKSHLLARFANWAAEKDRACYVFLHNIHVDPEGIDRYLLKCVVAKLAHDRFHQLQDTPLFRVVQAAILQAAREEGLTVLNDQNRQEVYGRLASRLGGDRDVLDVAFTFFHAASLCADKNKSGEVRHRQERRAALAVRWLQGDLLDVDEAQEIGKRVPPQQDVIQLANHQVQAVLLAIGRLACVSGRPLILCVDQVDNMHSEQVTALARSLHALIDRSTNLLVVVSGVDETIYNYIEKQIISTAAADRLDHQRPIEVTRLKKAEAKQILEERLHQFLSGFESIPELKKQFQKDSLFPLGMRWLDSKTGDGLEFRARDVLSWGRDAWQAAQRTIASEGVANWLKNWERPVNSLVPVEYTPEELQKAIDDKVAAKLEECMSARRLQRGGLPADADNLTGLVQRLLQQCVGPAAQEGKYTLEKVEGRQKKGDGWDILVHERYPAKNREWKNGVLFVATGSKTSAAAKLRNLAKWRADLRLLVTDHERMPLPLGAAGEQYLNDLQAMGPAAFRRVELTFDDYARLDALLAVAGLAKSQDLEVEPKPGQLVPVSETQVIEAHHRANRYVEHPLLRIFLTDETIEPPPPTREYPERDPFRAFVRARLALNFGLRLTELLRRLIAEERRNLEVEACLENARRIILEMHEEGLVIARPWDNDLFLQIGLRS